MTKIVDGRIMADLLFGEFDGKELAEKTSDFVNSFSYDKKGFIEAVKNRDDKERILDIAFLWILKLNTLKVKRWYDLRNEYSVDTGSELSHIFEPELATISEKYNYFGDFIDRYNVEHKADDEGNAIAEEVLFIETMARAHRTLQQSFSGIIFEVLSIIPEFEDRLAHLTYMVFYKTPLI